MAKRQFNNVAQMVQTQRSMEMWQSLDTLLLECHALRTSPSHALLLIKNQELVNKAVSDKKGLLECAKVLAKDVKEYGDKLTAIHTRHEQIAGDRKGDPTLNPDTLANLMSIGEEYSNWITSYQLVVIPSAFNVTAFFSQGQVPAPVQIQPLPDAPAASI
ncbi:hypothetical protein D3C85_108060 [compost metagenome]